MWSTEPSMASTKPSRDPTRAINTSLSPCHRGSAIESQCAVERRKENKIYDNLKKKFFFSFYYSKISDAGKPVPTLHPRPPTHTHTLGIQLNIVSIFLAASQSLNINLPVIGGENKQAIKNVTELTFSFLCLALPFHFAPTA